MKRFLHVIDLPFYISNHIVGKQHTIMHRKIVGIVVMFIGVSLAHASEHFTNIILSLSGDLIGYSIHGTGLLPFISSMEGGSVNKIQEQQNNNNEKDNYTTKRSEAA